MRKFWIMLLAAGLIMAFSVPAFAVNGASVNFSGSYYAAGIYEDNHSLRNTSEAGTKSAAFFAQRLRLQTDFKIAEGLVFVTRMDALEKKWGDNSWYYSAAYDVDNRYSNGQAGVRTQENMELTRAYVDFTTGIGRFMVGYQNFVSWGTDFGDTAISRPGIKYIVPVGPVTLVAALEQVTEDSCVRNGSDAVCGNLTDADYTIYDLGAIYKWQGGEAGLLVQYGRNASGNQLNTYKFAADPYVGKVLVFDPYVKATFGPVFVEFEGAYATGQYRDYYSSTKDIDVNAWGAYLHAKVDFKPAYAGFKFVWIRGDDPSTTDELEGNYMAALLAGQAFNPTLILWNDDLTTWTGNHKGYTTTANATSTFMDNVWFYQVYGGVKPIPQLDIFASLTYAYADEKPAGVKDKDYGYELDVTATYKIFDNLSYMIGGAYLWTGDYFKGNQTKDVENDYLIMHKLTLSF